MNTIHNNLFLLNKQFVPEYGKTDEFFCKGVFRNSNTALRVSYHCISLAITHESKFLISEYDNLEFLLVYFFFEIEHCFYFFFELIASISKLFVLQLDDGLCFQVGHRPEPLFPVQCGVEEEEVGKVVVLHGQELVHRYTIIAVYKKQLSE